MQVQCPECKTVAPADQVNMSTDLAFCSKCNEAFRISTAVSPPRDRWSDSGTLADVFRNPPTGAWYRRESDTSVIGATTRSFMAIFLVPFMCVWSGGSLGGIYGSQITSGEFSLFASLFGIPFVLGSVIFWTLALMMIFGRVELTIGRESSVFTGIGPLGWRRRFDWSAVHTIREETGRRQAYIVLEGRTRTAFGSLLNTERRYFVMNALKFLKGEMG